MREICGKCKWCKKSTGHFETWFCDQKDSDYYIDYTDYADTCEQFEQRGVE